MVNKSLNAALDAHFDQANFSGVVVKKPKPKKKKERVKKFSLLRAHLNSIKNYLFPGVEFEHVDISDFGTTIVSSVDKGIKCHIKIIKGWFKSKSSKKAERKIIEPEDVDLSAVRDVIRNNKLKK